MRSASVSQALRSLSPAHREVLNETYFCGRSVNEAARVLGLPVETVKCRVYDALHALRVHIGRIEQPATAPAADARPGVAAQGVPVQGAATQGVPTQGVAAQGRPGQGRPGQAQPGFAQFGHTPAHCGQRVNSGPAAPEWR